MFISRKKYRPPNPYLSVLGITMCILGIGLITPFGVLVVYTESENNINITVLMYFLGIAMTLIGEKLAYSNRS